MTQDSRIERLLNYLFDLAPDYFGVGIKPATEADIARLEIAGNRPVTGYHRALLLALGNSNPEDLFSFLNGRVFSIDELIRGYDDLADYGLVLPSDSSLFSTPEWFSEFEFLQTCEVTGHQKLVSWTSKR